MIYYLADYLTPYWGPFRLLKSHVLLMAGGTFYSVGHPSKAFNAVNGYALRRMARFLNRKSQRHYRLKFADTYYGELNHYGMHWLRWAGVRRRRY